MAKPWDVNAATAKRIAKDIITGEEENKEGVRLIHVVDRLDTFATDALNKKYAQYGSQASIHTYNGGRQTVDTNHADGTSGLFDSNGNNAPTDNAMDIEVENYINNNLDESKIYKNMKNVKRINESQLRAIVAESVKKVLAEKYNPFKRNDTEDGVEFPRYEKDTNPFREKIGKQAQHLYDQIEFFLQTLEHAYPNFPEDKAKNGNRSFGYEELERHLKSVKYELNSLMHPYCPYDGGADYSMDDYGY